MTRFGPFKARYLVYQVKMPEGCDCHQITCFAYGNYEITLQRSNKKQLASSIFEILKSSQLLLRPYVLHHSLCLLIAMEPWFLPAVIDHLVLGPRWRSTGQSRLRAMTRSLHVLLQYNSVATFLVDVYGVDMFFLPEVPVSSNVEKRTVRSTYHLSVFRPKWI